MLWGRQPSLPMTFSCFQMGGELASFYIVFIMNSFYLDVSIIVYTNSMYTNSMIPILRCCPNSVVLTSKKIYLKSVLCLDFKKMHYEFQSVHTDITHLWAWREEILVIEFLSCSRFQHFWTWILGLVCWLLQKRKIKPAGILTGIALILFISLGNIVILTILFFSPWTLNVFPFI